MECVNYLLKLTYSVPVIVIIVQLLGTLQHLKANKVFTAPCDTSVLYPTTGGNIHEFTAITPCAVLDVIGPPYSKEDGRDCSYYRDYPCDTFPKLPPRFAGPPVIRFLIGRSTIYICAPSPTVLGV
ncbi:2-aminoethanethiol dioxygenase-like, partial [Trifolium medium]|nr:2-aminoethanethiol dioxygenase-like [Trifolium medium]